MASKKKALKSGIMKTIGISIALGGSISKLAAKGLSKSVKRVNTNPYKRYKK